MTVSRDREREREHRTRHSTALRAERASNQWIGHRKADMREPMRICNIALSRSHAKLYALKT